MNYRYHMKAATLNYLQRLQAHKGGLIQLKTELFWYGGRGWDGTPGRICLLLDADATTATSAATSDAVYAAKTTAAVAVQIRAAALLLVDGAPHWVWVVEADVELL